MSLNWRWIIKNIVPILAVVLTIGGNVFVNTYFKPDLRYEVGTFYRAGDKAIVGLRLTNFGHGEAEDISVSVTCPQPILDIQTSGRGKTFYPLKEGGIGAKNITGTLDRLVPNETVFVYFAIKNDESLPTDTSPTIVAPQGITYKGGMATESRPSQYTFWVNFIFTIMTILGFLIVGAGIVRFWLFDKKLRGYYDQAEKAVEEREKIMKEKLEVDGRIARLEAAGEFYKEVIARFGQPKTDKPKTDGPPGEES